MKISVTNHKNNAFPNKDFNDIQLWEAFRSGDDLALAKIYATHVPVLYQHAAILSSDTGLAKDSIHDVFIDLSHYRETMGNVKNIQGYLFSSLLHKMQRNRKKSKTTSYMTLDTARLGEMAFDDPLRQRDNHRELRHRLREALKKIPERQRVAIYLRYFFNCNSEEVAHFMDISNQAARNMTCKAIKSLREILSNEEMKSAYFQRKTAS